MRPAFLSSRRGASLVILPRAVGVVGVSGASRGAIRGGERRERGPEGRSPRSGPLRGAPRAGSFSSSEPRGPPPGARRRGDAIRLLRGVLYQLRGVLDAVDADAAEERGGAADDVHRLHPRRRDEALHGRRGRTSARRRRRAAPRRPGGGGAGRRRRRAGARGGTRCSRAAADRGHRARDAPIGPFLGSVDRGERRDVEEAGGRVSASRGIGRFVRLVRRLANERDRFRRDGERRDAGGGGGGRGRTPCPSLSEGTDASRHAWGGYCVEGGRTSRRVSAPGRRGDVGLPPRARSFLRGKMENPPPREVGVSGARRDRGEARPCARTWALLGRRGRGRRGGRSGRCLRGTRARRASSVSRSRAVSGGSRGRGKEDVARGVFNRWSGCRRDTHHGRGRGRVRPRGRERRACDEGRGEGWVSDAFGAPPARLHREKGFGGGTSGPWRRTRCRLLRERLQLREAHHAELFRLRRGHRRALPHDRRRRRRHVETISGAREK